MLSEIVKVSSIDPRFVRFKPFNNSSCTSCELKPTCGQYLLNSFSQNRELAIPHEILQKEIDTRSLKNGTQVQINIEAKKLVQISLQMYFLPVLGILLVALIAQLAGFNEMVILALVVFVLCFSMTILHRYFKKHIGLRDINLSLIPDSD